jgi:hypothetical protein
MLRVFDHEQWTQLIVNQFLSQFFLMNGPRQSEIGKKKQTPEIKISCN